MLRAKHAKLYRAIDARMREGWHTPQAKIMMPFMELSDVLGLPSARHKLDVGLKGMAFTLMSEKDNNSEVLMRTEIPPIRIAKAPRVGVPLPPATKLSITFDAPIEVRCTPMPSPHRCALCANMCPHVRLSDGRMRHLRTHTRTCPHPNQPGPRACTRQRMLRETKHIPCAGGEHHGEGSLPARADDQHQ